MATPSPTATITTASPSPAAESPYSVTVDVAAITSAFFWFIIVLTILYMLRKKLPEITHNLFSRVTKIGLTGFTLELTEASLFTPKWSDLPKALDLRSRAKAADITDSTARNFISQLLEFDTADYATINLGAGDEWLTSRLYIMAIVLGRMRGLKALVFTGTRKCFIGWAEPETVRWALAMKYPYLEKAYACAYSKIPGQFHETSEFSQQPKEKAKVVTRTGRLGFETDSTNPYPSILLIQEFLEGIQERNKPKPSPGELETDWILIDSDFQTYEHASWLTADKVADLLEKDLCVTCFDKESLEAENPEKQIRLVLSTPHRWIALTTDKQFEGLSDRNLLLKQVSQQVTKNISSSN